MQFNWLAIIGASLIPMLLGFIYYHPAVMGKMWMDVNGFKEEDLKQGSNMAVIFISSFILSFLLAFSMQFIVIHQNHVGSILMNHPEFQDPTTELGKWFADFMSKYGREFRTFKHGALHGVITAIFTILPVMGTSALFERRGGKYIFVNILYWIICFAIMGGIISQWA